MSEQAHDVHYSFREYLRLEQYSNVKHEYLDGQIFAMGGGTPDHALVAANVTAILRGQLAGKRCAVFSADLRVRVPATGLATYPDVSVVCGRRETDPEDEGTVVNPTVLVEVLSPSTAKYDRGQKFDHYRRIPTLREYVLVAHDEAMIEVRSRADDGSWTVQRAKQGERVALGSIECELAVDDVYSDPLAE